MTELETLQNNLLRLFRDSGDVVSGIRLSDFTLLPPDLPLMHANQPVSSARLEMDNGAGLDVTITRSSLCYYRVVLTGAAESSNYVYEIFAQNPAQPQTWLMPPVDGVPSTGTMAPMRRAVDHFIARRDEAFTV